MKTKLNEDDNELPGVRLCVGVLGCCNGAGHIRYRAGGSRQALQRGHAKGLVSVDLRRVRKTRWEPGTDSRYARPPVQRRWYDVQSFGTVNIGGTIIFDATGGRNLYGRTGLHRHLVTGARHSPKL